MSTPWIPRHDSGPDAPDTGGAPQHPSAEPAWYAGQQHVVPRPPAGNGLAIAGMTWGSSACSCGGPVSWPWS